MLANHCRANLLLEKEYFKLRKNPIWGIDAVPLAENDFLKWQAIIRGPRESIWEGGVFKIYLSFSEEYNFKPPDVFFHTIPFHPNVDMKTGIPCVDFLTDVTLWKQSYNVPYVLLQLQVMLDNPVLENPVNLEAANMFRNRPKQYRQMVLDCVFTSKRLEAGLMPQLASPVQQENKAGIEKIESRTKSRKRISFEDYYKTWVNIATSKTNTLEGKPFDEGATNDVFIDEMHFGVLKSELEEELKRQLSEHNSLMYGRFANRRLRDEERIAELQTAKAQLLKQMYFKDEGPAENFAPAQIPPLASDVDSHDDPIDEEVDKLVSWTENLPGIIE